MSTSTVAVVTSVAALVAALPGPVATASPSSSSSLKFDKVTVTAARQSGNSAVAMSITDGSSSPVSLLSVTSPVSRMSMIYYDDNMCQGNSKMTWLANIFISPGHVQRLGYRYQGAMLGNLRSVLRVGHSIPITISWSDFSAVRKVTVMATVVAPPKGLHFLQSPMKM